MTKGYAETAHGEFNILYVQSFKTVEEFLKAEILAGHSDRVKVLTDLWNKCKKPEPIKAPAAK